MRLKTSPDSFSFDLWEKICLAKFSPFLIEKVIATRTTEKKMFGKQGMETCLSRVTAGSRQKTS